MEKTERVCWGGGGGDPPLDGVSGFCFIYVIDGILGGGGEALGSVRGVGMAWDNSLTRVGLGRSVRVVMKLLTKQARSLLLLSPNEKCQGVLGYLCIDHHKRQSEFK